MVSAGLISFYNSLAIFLGADLGTTVIVQLVVWKITDASPLFVIVGGMLWFTGKEKWQGIGESIFYFGLLFFGLSMVGTATLPLKNHPEIVGFFRDTQHPLTGFALSALFTALVHASAIPISILAILAQQDLISLANALPMVIGANVGTTVTALMAGMVSGIGGKRAAVSHLFFKAAGALICMAALPVMLDVLRDLSPNVAQQIALGHFLFNLIIVILFFPFIRNIARLLERIIPGTEEVLPLWPEFLREEVLAEPAAALGTVEKELAREILLTEKMFALAAPLLQAYHEGRRRDVLYIEMVANHLRQAIVEYLRKISCNELSEPLSQELFAYTAMADDIERMGNHIVSFVDLAREKHYREIEFTHAAEKELGDIEKQVAANIAGAGSLIGKHDGDKTAEVYRRENDIDNAVKEARGKHLVRFHQRLCPAEAGPIFIEMLIHLERISDHCQNIAEHVEDLPIK
jgi:phosphate:Na+ symporter